MRSRVVFDTNTVVSALIFPGGRLSWLRAHWSSAECMPLLSRATAAELVRVLKYPKFALSSEDQTELLADYVPFCEIVECRETCPQKCRDPQDQRFLDLAFCGKADVLVTGDNDLLVLLGSTRFPIQTPESYRKRVQPDGQP